MKTMMQLAQGNPGALTCLMGMMTGEIAHSIAGLVIVPVIEKLNIEGTDIYVLWSDLCGKDYDLMAHLCDQVPEEILKDACSRQDYSGRGLVSEWIQTYKSAYQNN